MIFEWGTVAGWHNGVALISCNVKSSCGTCASGTGCGMRLINRSAIRDEHHLHIAWSEPLEVGQKVELGVNESSLLGSALLIYMLPLAGLFVLGGLLQMTFGGNFAPLIGALFGGAVGLLLARVWAAKLTRKSSWQPTIISVGSPVQKSIIFTCKV